jgi:hypothetical protein
MRDRWPAYALWAISRAVVVWWLIARESDAQGDLHYYADTFTTLHAYGVGHTLAEYPIPAFVLLVVPWLLLKAVHLQSAYPGAIAACAVLTDLLFLQVLLHARRWAPDQRRVLGVTASEGFWLAAVPALGATTIARFDLIPGVLVGLALLYAVHRPSVAAAFGALATGVKYWPAIVLPTLAAPAETRRLVVRAVAAVGLLLGVLSLAVGGWHRIVTPLEYQGDRGLQIESIFATPAMVDWARDPVASTVFYSSSHSYQVAGPKVAVLLHASSAATVVMALVLLALWIAAWLRLRRMEDSISALVWLVLASISTFMITSKALSPQYMLWLLPGVTAGLLVLRRHGCWSRLASWSMVLLVCTVMTHYIFPLYYSDLVNHTTRSGAVVALLVMRNVLIVGLCLYALLEAALQIRAVPRTEEPASSAETVGALRH